MKKIRINELARELEVKPGVILDLLPDLGVQEKKTHSSSIDEDVAIALRDRLHTNGIPEGGSANGDEDHYLDDEFDSSAEDEVDESRRETPQVTAQPQNLDRPAQSTTQQADRPPAERRLNPPAAAFVQERTAPSIPLLRPSLQTTSPRAEPAVSTGQAEATASATVKPDAQPTPAVTTPVSATPGMPLTKAEGTPSASEAEAQERRPFQPLRPPIFGGGGAIQPPLASPSAGPQQSGPVNRSVSTSARPLPGAVKPGAVASGPRQPLPPDLGKPTVAIPRPPLAASSPAAPAAPAPSAPLPAAPQGPSPMPARPSVPAPPQARPQAPLGRPQTPIASRPAGPAQPPTSPLRPSPPPAQGNPNIPPTHVMLPGPGPSPSAPSVARPGAPTPRPPQTRPSLPTLTPGAPIAPRPQGTRMPLAGQPSARPIVPPRPDLVARLQQQSRPMQASPAAPRPGAPARPVSPAPGRPIYPGPVRPGQPQARGPMPGSPGQQQFQRRPGGARPMHPTTPLRAEPATPLPGDQPRRHQAKPGGARLGPRKREDREEGNLRENRSKRHVIEAPPPIDREITVAEGITVKELSEKLGVKANLVIKKLVDKKIFANINQTLDVKLAEEMARAFGASTNQVSYEEEESQEVELAEDTAALVRRAPVVTIMGHVDHGKTSLLDSIRQTNVAGREAGGITQHIGAYRIEKNDRKIVFIDTPGHQAFTRMRARGAQVTDIVVLVVSADDGVMPQTLEAMDHAKAAKVPIIVAINKIDKPDSQPDRVKQQLADRGLLAEDWGGDVVMQPVSAKTGQNLDLLLEMILLVADIQDLKANPARPAVGTVLEAQLDRGRGPVATVLVRNGTLRVGEFFICGALFSKVRAMFDDRGNPVREAEPSMPVEVIGFDDLPEVGDGLQVVSDTSKAKQIVIYRESKARDAAMAKGARVATLDSLRQQFKEGDLKELNLIIKADVGGTAEVLSDTLQQLSNDKIRVRVLRAGVGAINESDVLLASASEAIVIGFNSKAERNAASLADQQKVDIRQHTIIYELIDEIRLAMSGMLDPVFREVIQGHAEVKQTFHISKTGTVAGCYVSDGAIRRDSQIRIKRDGDLVHTGKIETLKRFKNDASEVKNGLECGISIVNFNNIKEGDILEAFFMERMAVELPA